MKLNRLTHARVHTYVDNPFKRPKKRKKQNSHKPKEAPVKKDGTPMILSLESMNHKARVLPAKE